VFWAIAFTSIPIPALAPNSLAAIRGSVWIHADPDGVGSGWIADAERRWIVTCRHVVGERKTADIFFPWYRQGQLVAERSEYLANREELRRRGLLVLGRILRSSDELDLALIEVPSLPPFRRALAISAAPPRPGQAIFSIGNRGDVETLWNSTSGWLRQSGSLTDGYFWQSHKLAVQLPAMVAQLPIEEGDSGGPVLNTRGEVVGTISALRRRSPLSAVGPNAEALRAFLKLSALPEVAIEDDLPFGSVVWVQPTATDSRLTGVVIDVQRRWVLTAASGLRTADRVAVAFPLIQKGRVIPERDRYQDRVGLALAGNWKVGTILLRDPVRDLALIQLDELPANVKPVSISRVDPRASDAVHLISHPMGLEFAWVYAGGTLRQRGRVALGRDAALKIDANLFQLPAQGNAAGGVVLNANRELIGILSGKEGPQQQVAYAAALPEIHDFLESLPGQVLQRQLVGLAQEFNSLSRFAAYGWLARMDLDKALTLHPECIPARWLRAPHWLKRGRVEEAMRELDAVLIANPQHRDALKRRVECWLTKNEPKNARGDCERILELTPLDWEAHRLHALALARAGDEEKAAVALAQAIRVRPRDWNVTFQMALLHAEGLERRDLNRAVQWLRLALEQIHQALPEGNAKTELVRIVAKAGAEKEARKQLAILHAAGE
jgi:S1-C subfamily serine protease/Flp pilus assembly protein TadD